MTHQILLRACARADAQRATLIAAPAFGRATDARRPNRRAPTTFNDSHFHLTNYVQEGTTSTTS